MKLPTVAVLLVSLSVSLVGLCHAGICSQQRGVLDALMKTEAQTWFPEPCTRCSCSGDGEDECVPVQCLASTCAQNEVLTFNSTSCCPICAPVYSDCLLDGVIIKHGTTHRSPQCEQCDCVDGALHCQVLSCSQIHCSTKTEDECCRNCSTNMCEDGGVLHSDRSSWSKGSCVLCQCDRGVKTCFAHVCPALDCKQAYTPDGACCPICPNQCWSNGTLYKAGQRWKPDPCTNCICISGKPNCFSEDCFDYPCPQNTRAVLKPESCCPTCLPEYGMCTSGDKSYSNGQIWNVNECEYCTCVTGRISCGQAQCAITQCDSAANEYLHHEEGSCCPVCKLEDVCIQGGALHTTKIWETWEVNPCKQCLCRAGETQCYESMCIHGRPTYGTLHGGNKEFSYQELSDGLLYQHDGSAEPDDLALLQASDSENLQNILLPISVQPSEELWVVNSVPLEVQFGQQGKIASENLLYEAGRNDKKHLIQYTITTPPTAGSVVMIVQQPEDSDPQAGWTSLDDDTMLKQVTDFTQTDIDEELIFYQHESGSVDVTTDIFAFKVVYMESGAILADQMLPINIVAAAVFNAPNVSPGTSLGLSAFEGATVILTPSHLSFIDDDTPPGNIIYDITEPLLPELGMIEYISDPQVPVMRFTQNDINSGSLAYRSPSNLEVGLTQPTFSFKFNVTDDNGKIVPEQQFNILILPVDNKAPSVGGGVRLNVERDRSVLISDELLGVTDVDTEKAELMFSLASPPAHGDIVKIDETFNTVLRPGAEYSYTEMLSNTLYYVHDGSLNVNDSFTLRLSDSEQATEAVIPVTVHYSDNDSPTLSPGATMKLRLNEGEKKVITMRELEYEDSSADGLVLYQIASEPRFGRILYNNEAMKLGDGFTQPDITSRLVSYESDEELGNLEIMDTIYLNVSDTSGNLAAWQPFTISIRATDNHPPIPSINSEMEVEEGRRKQLTKVHISAEDPDSIVTNLLVIVDSVPTLGILKIISSEGLERSIRQSQVHMFLLSDLYAGIVYYEQTDHQNKEPRNDFFWFHMSDGENISPVARFNITITPRNDEPPVIVADTLFVEEGDTVPITNSSVYVNDIDTEFDGTSAHGHIFTLVKLPRQGSLQRENGTDIDLGESFTMQEMLDGEVFYSHDGREDVSQDSFTLTVSDGFFEDTKQIPIDIALIDDETPRVKINDGLRFRAGGEAIVDRSVLHSTDIDSDDDLLLYMVTQPVYKGSLYRLDDNGTEEPVTVFTPSDLTTGFLRYRNDKDMRRGGFDFFKFDVVDVEGNRLMDQVFYIDLIADTTPPRVRANSRLSVKENGFSPITTSHLYVSDVETSPDLLNIYIDTKPRFGSIVLEDDHQKSRAIHNFTMADVVANRVFYVHESEEEVEADSFTFTVSDGSNNVTQTFRIRLIPVDDSLPVITLGKLITSEGSDKLLTEFDIKVSDNDTEDESLVISLLAPPTHGSIILMKNGQEVNAQCLVFTMADIYNGYVTYRHDNSETSADSFSFTVTDQTNSGFFLEKDGQLIRTRSPLTMEITVQLLDDGVPRVLVNAGIPHLETNKDGKSVGKINGSRLKVVDPDTSAEFITIKVIRIPRNGVLSLIPDNLPVSQFTQEDVNNELIMYTMGDDVSETSDSFGFSIMDSRPNTVRGLTFHITWSFVELSSVNITAPENQPIIEVPVVRRGSLRYYATVGCNLERDGADDHYSSDLVVITPQIQFEKGSKSAMCRFSVINDTIYEKIEHFVLKLVSPEKVLIGRKRQTLITLTDVEDGKAFTVEDEPVIAFMKPEITVNESVGSAHVPIIRSGDTSNSMVVLCTTKMETALGSSGNHLRTGTDYLSKTDHVVRFEAGETTANCDITILDDTLYEAREEFEVTLTDPSDPARLGRLTTASVIIAGPNDAPSIQMTHPVVKVYEDEEFVSIGIVRLGLDLSKPANVWCTTGMVSADDQPATPSVDYLPISQKVGFSPGQSQATCDVIILDDSDEPITEGEEKFSVTIGAADSSSVIGGLATTIVTIDDSDLDVPELKFETAKYTINEDLGILSLPITRIGDVSCTVSVICYTRQQTASVMADYVERTLTNSSRVELLAGVRTATCDLEIVDENLYETSEFLLVRLAEPVGCGAIIGDLDVTLITINDPEDEPLISIGSSSYTTREPISDADYKSVKVHVNRHGDVSQSAQVRLSTRDRSAVSGIDYTATSAIVSFLPSEKAKFVDIRILYNPEVEWHESFVVLLEDFVGASAGVNDSAVINVLDTDVAGGLVLPSIPIVVSLKEYESGKCSVVTEVSPGYPLICLSPCDPIYPQYIKTKELCKSSNINSSSMSYGWEVSYPVQSDGKVSSYLKVTQATTFSRVDTMLLETFYFRSGFNVRCIATPLHASGQSGVPIRSSSVSVHSKGMCSNPVILNSHGALGAQSFAARLDYVGPEAETGKANKIHITVEIPHQDGMLPVLSTLPIYNIDYLLTQSSFTKQHVCSNLPNTSASDTHDLVSDFLSHSLYIDDDALSGLRVDEAIRLYRHLDRMTCRWKFEAWFDLSSAVDSCGGRVTNNFDVDSSSSSFVTVHQPLYVSYIFAKAPIGWASLDHQTTLEVSFYYDTAKFQSGVDIMREPRASVHIARVGIGEDGKLAIQLRSHSQFKGLMVTEHYTATRGQKAQLIAPESVDTKFRLKHIWTQPTLDGPIQIWRASSIYSLQDYTGVYTLKLLACVANPTEAYNPGAKDQKCAVEKVLSFPIRIAFQQTNRPVPAVYSLATQFQVTNNKRFFLLDPQSADLGDSGQDFHGAFRQGDKLFGRVFWDRNQDLESAFRLQLDKVFVCSGKNGFTPTYDPTGKIYNEEPQYGCLENSNKLKHRFLLLDRGQEDVTTKEFNGLPFKANFAGGMSGLAEINNMPSTDGFVMSVDPLFATTSGQRWYVHILYRIGSADSMIYGRRRRRSLEDSGNKTGTNLIMINLQEPNGSLDTLSDKKSDRSDDSKVITERMIETKYVTNSTIIIVLVVVVLLVIISSVSIVIYVKKTTKRATQTTSTVSKNGAQSDDPPSSLACSDDLPPSYNQITHNSFNSKIIGTAV